jgi:acetylornithine/succinyldiaminopimelate/putrescine aminotransferase
MSDTQQILDRGQRVLIGNYARLPVVMARGEGSLVWDTNGKRYLDLFAGFGGAILGHCHPALVAAATEQAQRLWHVGNTFWTGPQIELAERLNKHAFPGQAFFCHSGLEANEAAVKLARLRGATHSPKRWKVVTLNRSFHGRSLAMIAATGNPAVKAGFEPAVPGFSHVELGDLEGLTAAVDNETAAIVVEPIQGEGGVHPVPTEYVVELRKICDHHGITLIFDEVWTGCGRTGRWFAHQHFHRSPGLRSPELRGPGLQAGDTGDVVTPDIMTLGKAVGGGLPVGVMFAKPEIAKLLVPGKHGATLGGNPICANVAKTIFDVIERDRLLDHAQALGEHAVARLRNEPRLKDKVAEVRGRGLFLGIELKAEPDKGVERALDRGVIINLTSKKVIRLAPPINITRDEWDQGLNLVVETLAS